MKKFFLTGIIIFAFLSFFLTRQTKSVRENAFFWDLRSIDTMKYSRDLSREKLHDGLFDAVIEQQVREIAQTGATHVAIATPYDEEFLPFLRRWVNAARRHNLNVWFRGNWSGWEGWFNHPKIDRSTHIQKTLAFISENKDLFVDGDIFTPCPECENGGPGDPRKTGDVQGHRDFLTEESKATKAAFEKIGKDVRTNYASMNADVARLVMDKETTQKLGGIVTIDHYVSTPEKLVSDIQEIAKNSGGYIVLGEWGAPIGDIHGTMSEEEQAAWIGAAFERFVTLPELKGMNYWVNVGSSAQLWSSDGKARKAVGVVTKYYTVRKTKI